MAAKIDISLDDLQIDFYKRKSDWKAGADLRYEIKTPFLIPFLESKNFERKKSK